MGDVEGCDETVWVLQNSDQRYDPTLGGLTPVGKEPFCQFCITWQCRIAFHESYALVYRYILN